MTEPHRRWGSRRLKSSFACCALFGSVFAGAAHGADEPAEGELPTTPNVVIILADDLGWGDIGANNPDSGLSTPNIDGIAADGMRFSDAHSPASVCTPTRYGLLTGRYGWRTRLQRATLSKYDPALIAAERLTLGELLGSRGYRTAAIGKWHLGMTFGRLPEEEWAEINEGLDYAAEIVDSPVDRGFDEFFGLSAGLSWSPFVYIRDDRFTAVPTRLFESPYQGLSAPEVPIADDFDHFEVLDRLTEEAVAFIDRSSQSAAPFFLYFPAIAPHGPFVAASRFSGTTGMGPYGDYVAQLDWVVGEVLNALDEGGVADDTLVVFASDNGSRMRVMGNRERDHVKDRDVLGYRAKRHLANGGWRGGKGEIHEGGHRVPFLVRWPGLVAAGSETSATVSQIDIFATLAEIFQADLAAEEAPDSVSFLPVLRGDSWERGLPLVHHSRNGMFAIRDGRWKLVLGNGHGGAEEEGRGEPFTRPYQLYDLSADPAESDNVVEDHPTVSSELEGALEEIRSTERALGRLRDAYLTRLTLAGVDTSAFIAGVTAYAAEVPNAVTTTTVSASKRHADAELAITPVDADSEADGHQVALFEGPNEIVVAVTAADGETTRRYRVTVTRIPLLRAGFTGRPSLHSGVRFTLRLQFSEPVASDLATMHGEVLTVTNGAVASAVRVDERSDLWDIAVDPTAAADIVVTLPATADCAAAGAVCTTDGRGLSHPLAVTVLAGEDAKVPAVSVAPASVTGVEGGEISFTVSRTGLATVDTGLVVNMEVSAGGGEQWRRRHTVDLGDEREKLLLLELTDDQVAREAVTVTRTVLAGSGYRVSPDAGTAQTVLEDNDVPSFAVSAEPGGIEEGQSASVTVAITNAVTFAEEQTLGLAVSGVAASDYSLAPETLTLPAGSSSAAAILSASSDDLDESVETASVVASLAGASVGSATVVIADPLPVPGIAGVPQVGGSLEATFEEAVPAEIRYQWLRGAGGEEISGAVGASYTAVEADEDEAVSVRVDLGNAAVAHTSAATAPVWPAASNPPLHGRDEELLGATMTLGSSDAFPLWLAGYGRFEGVAFGSMDRLSFSVGDVEHELTVAMVNAQGGFALQASPRIADVSGLVVYWNDYRIESLAPDNGSDPQFWVASTPQPKSEYGRYWRGASDGVQVALSIRRPMPEDDASLSALTLSDVDIGAFDSEVTSYTAEVGFSVEMTTLEAVASDDRAVIEIADSVGSTMGPLRTSRLAGGANEITVTVTAADQETTRTYAVTVTRSVPRWGSRLRSRDISLSEAETATGVWSDGSTMWVVTDRIEGVVQGYSLADGSRLAERDLELVGGYGYTTALWSDGSTLWAADYYGGVLGYRLSDGARLADKDLDGAVLSAAGNDNPGGLWSDGTTLWVADHEDGWVYAYLLSDGSRVSAEEFSVRTSHHHGMSPFGLWFGDGTVLASYWARGLVMAYRESDGSHLGSREIDTGSSGNDFPRGLWSDGSTLWVADEVDLKLYAYAVPVSVAASQVSVESGPFGPIPPSWAPAVPSASPGPSVFVPDAGLRSRLEAALGKAPGESIGTREMAALEALNLDGSAPDLWALTGLAGLKRLSLRGNDLEDLSALSLLTNLEVLDIGENRIVDLGPLAALTGLESLRADGNRIRDPAPLAGLPGLVRLDAGGNRIGDFSALEGNRRLRVLGTDEQEAPPPR